MRVPVLDTGECEVEIEDSEVSTNQANLISERLRAAVDEQGMLLQLMYGIIDHHCNARAVKRTMVLSRVSVVTRFHGRLQSSGTS